jgi:hypothetical protein
MGYGPLLSIPTYVLSTYMNIERAEGLHIQNHPGIDCEYGFKLYQNQQDI